MACTVSSAVIPAVSDAWLLAVEQDAIASASNRAEALVAKRRADMQDSPERS
jgi:hypothetical protein